MTKKHNRPKQQTIEVDDIHIFEGISWHKKANGMPKLKTSEEALEFARRHSKLKSVIRYLRICRRRYKGRYEFEKEKGFPDMDRASREAFNLQLINEASREWEKLQK